MFMKEPMLTTLDNPHNPFTEWDEWYVYDMARYNTCGLLARITFPNDEIDDLATEIAMREVAANSLSGLHVVVTSESINEMLSANDVKALRTSLA